MECIGYNHQKMGGAVVRLHSQGRSLVERLTSSRSSRKATRNWPWRNLKKGWPLGSQKTSCSIWGLLTLVIIVVLYTMVWIVLCGVKTRVRDMFDHVWVDVFDVHSLTLGQLWKIISDFLTNIKHMSCFLYLDDFWLMSSSNVAAAGEVWLVPRLWVYALPCGQPAGGRQHRCVGWQLKKLGKSATGRASFWCFWCLVEGLLN